MVAVSVCHLAAEPSVDESGFNKMDLNEMVERNADVFKQPSHSSELEQGKVMQFVFMFYTPCLEESPQYSVHKTNLNIFL